MTGPALFRSNTQYPRLLGRGVLSEAARRIMAL